MKRILFIVAFTIIFCGGVLSQSINKISTRCLPPNQSTTGSVVAQNTGDIVFTPCSTRSSIFNGNVDFSGATVTGIVTGSGTANFVPRFTAASVLGNTPLSWNNTSYSFDNAGVNAVYKLSFTPSLGQGTFIVGTPTATNNYGIDINNILSGGMFVGNLLSGNLQFDSVGNASLQSSAAHSLTLVAPGAGTFLNLRVGSGNSSALNLDSTNDALLTTLSTWNLQGVTTINLERTLTAAGTTGNQTINKPNGVVNFAAATDTLDVTNAFANATSTIIVTAQALDTTCTNFVISAKISGGFTISSPAVCSGETPVAFWVFN